MQEEIEQKSFNLMISTTKLSARTVLRAIKAALRLYQSKASQGSKVSAPFCGQTVAYPAWKSARPASVGWNAMPKKYGIDYAIRKDTSEVPPRYLVFFQSPGCRSISIGVQGVFGIPAEQG